MNSRTVRTLLLLIAFGAVIAGSVVIVGAERELTASVTSATGFDAQARRVTEALARLQSAQQAYVAEGQNASHWMAQSARVLSEVDQGLAELAQASSADATRSAVQAAAASLEQFRALDTRARRYVENGQVLLASDVIFTESLSALGAAAGHLAVASDNERASRAGEASALRSRQFYAAGGGAALLLLAVLMLVPVPESDVDVLTAMRALTESAPRPQPTPAAKPKLEPAADQDGSSARLVTPPPPAPPAPAVDLAAASRVCAELARVTDAGDIPALLARAAGVLDARGIIVWVTDTQATTLYPMVTHGYAPAVLMRLGTLGVDANNATAAAWRTGELHAVERDADGHGALVTPIVTADGCVGVLAAELAEGREMREDVRALATIFSAQLATVVTPVAAVAGQTGLVDRVAT